MATIILETLIDAPAAVCFDLLRDTRLHIETTARTDGEFGLWQTVTFEGTRFGMSHRLTVKVIAFERPTLLVDEMTEGRFRSFKHIHGFTQNDGVTLMRDTIEWTSPLGILGRIVDHLVLKRQLTNIVSNRNSQLKMIAESHQS